MTHVPQVPCTQACPPSHWLFDVHAVHAPPTHTCPLGTEPKGCPAWVQSAFLEHAVQTPAMQVWPFAQSEPDWQVPHKPPSTHPCPVWQLAALLQEQIPPEQVPAEPHCESDVHWPQTPPTQALPAEQSWLVAHEVVQVPDAHACPVAQSLLAEHEQ